jgi:hypothetical protein
LSEGISVVPDFFSRGESGGFAFHIRFWSSDREKPSDSRIGSFAAQLCRGLERAASRREDNPIFPEITLAEARMETDANPEGGIPSACHQDPSAAAIFRSAVLL